VKRLKNNPLISIIILSYKNLSYIYETINSVLEQVYSNIELIISDDGTENFCQQEYIDYIKLNNKGNISNVIVHTNKINKGTVKNINNAISMSKGKYIKLIAADDAFYDGTVIASFVSFFENTSSLIVASKIEICDSELKVTQDHSYNYAYNETLKNNLNNLSSKECFVELCKENFISAPSVCFAKELFEIYGLFDEKYILVEDYPMWLKLFRVGCKIDYHNIVSVKYRTEVGVTGSPNKIFAEDMKRCFNTEIQPYKDILGYWQHKKIVYSFIKKRELKGYSSLHKIIFLVENIDYLLVYSLPKKILSMVTK
jgi:glycosyltransferase involved in cell wall biosynthesis